METNSKTSQPRRKKFLVATLTSFVIIVAISLSFLFMLMNDYPPKERIEVLALKAAKEYCTKNQQFEPTYCDTLRVTETRGPMDYGPTDGRDEYIGNWFVTTKSSSKPKSLIYVVTDFSGEVQYLNTTGQNEYPYCKDGYAVYPEQPEENGKTRCGYYKE